MNRIDALTKDEAVKAGWDVQSEEINPPVPPTPIEYVEIWDAYGRSNTEPLQERTIIKGKINQTELSVTLDNWDFGGGYTAEGLEVVTTNYIEGKLATPVLVPYVFYMGKCERDNLTSNAAYLYDISSTLMQKELLGCYVNRNSNVGFLYDSSLLKNLYYETADIIYPPYAIVEKGAFPNAGLKVDNLQICFNFAKRTGQKDLFCEIRLVKNGYLTPEQINSILLEMKQNYINNAGKQPWSDTVLKHLTEYENV